MIDLFLDKLKSPWIVVGLIGQIMFFSRFIVQWIASEKKGESVIPYSFWILSLAGGSLLTFYAFHIKDPIFFLGSLLNIFIYSRNIILINRKERNHGTG